MSAPSILIVEDEIIVAHDLAGKISQFGYEVAGTLTTGEEAVDFVRHQPPALVLLDIHLAGEMNGIAAAMEIRRVCDLPVVFLTAHSDAATVAQVQQAEAFAYILKPFGDRDLHVQIEMALYKHAAEKRLRESHTAALNLMQDAISARQQAEAAELEFRNLNRELEFRVLERTAKLHDTIAALESEISRRHRLEREILEISEREQSRIGQDLHDGLGQELSAIAMLADVNAKLLQTESHPQASAAATIATHVRAAIDSTRRLAKGLYPLDLDRYGLLHALGDLAHQTTLRSGITCELRQTGDEPQLGKSAQIHIYRIIQESIGNAIKHAMPGHITIESVAGGDTHDFSVTDDGVGFEKPEAASGMGLHLMEYRTRVIGANLSIEQPASGGCRVTCRIPRS